MSESDTMFNERDQRCAAVQLMLYTDPSYDNRTIASNLKMQIRMVQRAQGDKNKVSGYHYGLWCGFKWGPNHATSHLRSRLESQQQSVPGYAEDGGDPLVQSKKIKIFIFIILIPSKFFFTRILTIVIFKDIRGWLKKFPDFFRMSTFIDNTHLKL